MFFTSKLFRAITIAILISSFAVFAAADTIKLKDGSTIKGTILSFTNGQFVILIGDGARQRKMNFFADEIEAIEFDGKSTIGSAVVDNTEPESKPAYSTQTDGNTTIITVGSASKTPNPQTRTEPRNETPRTVSTSAAKPIQVKVNVLADNTANGWTNAGWVVRKGQRIKITSDGRISLGNGRFSGPRGISTLPDENKLIADKPTGSLIAVIGDDNNDFIYVGESIEFTAERDGALFLGINEGVLDDNSGAFDVLIEIDPNIDDE